VIRFLNFVAAMPPDVRNSIFELCCGYAARCAEAAMPFRKQWGFYWAMPASGMAC
jgi:hypothetical protein